jgi:hypothetical protein
MSPSIYHVSSSFSYNSGLSQNKVSGSTFQSWRESPKWIYAGIQELATFSPLPMMLHASLPEAELPFLWIQASPSCMLVCTSPSSCFVSGHVPATARRNNHALQTIFFVLDRLFLPLLSLLSFYSLTAPTPIGLVLTFVCTIRVSVKQSGHFRSSLRTGAAVHKNSEKNVYKLQNLVK